MSHSPLSGPVEAPERERFLTVQQYKAKVLAAHRWGTEEDQADARRDLAMAKIEAYAAKVVAEAPPLTDEQRERLAGLLNGAA